MGVALREICHSFIALLIERSGPPPARSAVWSRWLVAKASLRHNTQMDLPVHVVHNNLACRKIARCEFDPCCLSIYNDVRFCFGIFRRHGAGAHAERRIQSSSHTPSAACDGGLELGRPAAPVAVKCHDGKTSSLSPASSLRIGEWLVFRAYAYLVWDLSIFDQSLCLFGRVSPAADPDHRSSPRPATSRRSRRFGPAAVPRVGRLRRQTQATARLRLLPPQDASEALPSINENKYSRITENE